MTIIITITHRMMIITRNFQTKFIGMRLSPKKTVARNYSDSFNIGESDYDLLKNRNIDWIDGPFTKIAISYSCSWCGESFISQEVLMIWVFGLLLILFIFFHWIKGCPDDSTQGEYNGLTLFEQIDAGVPWTATKKFLMLVPTILT